MALDPNELSRLAKAQLSPSELGNSIVYLLTTQVAKGSTLEFPQVSITAPWQARVAFIDLDPLANFGHACRYVLINPGTGETKSVDARFPPFRSGAEDRWQVVYKAPGVPDSALAAPKKRES
jgi:hypothetical protein